jgi:5'-nucleotidase
MLALGEVLIVAPRDQQTSTGRAFRGGGVAEPMHYEIDGKRVRAFAVAATPAVAVRYALQIIAERKPALFVSGINYGENIGNGVTISGTIGACLEAASSGIPALAVSQSLHTTFHYSHSDQVDFSVAAKWGKQFARRILKRGLPRGADVVNVNVPEGANQKTPLRWTRVSRMNYYRSTIKETQQGRVIEGYELTIDPRSPEPGSDVRAILIDHVVSVSFLTLDLTARVSEEERARWGK